DDGADVRVLEHLDAVTGRGHEDAPLPPLPGPDGGGGDLAVPRIPLAHLLGGGGEHVDVVVGQHPVLLGDQVEVADAGGDRVRGRLRQHVHGVGHVVVGLLARALVGVLARVAAELAADQGEVVGFVAVAVGDAAVPAGHTGARLDR